MHQDPAIPTTTTTTISVDPSRAWILGLVVGPDGSVSGPGLERAEEWPVCECPDDCGLDHENA